MAKPCLTCGEPTTGTHCDEHRRTYEQHAVNPADPRHRQRWKALSARLRRVQAWCSACGTTADLTVDHIKPLSKYPELAWEITNLDVLCRTCNARKRTREPRGRDPARLHSRVFVEPRSEKFTTLRSRREVIE